MDLMPVSWILDPTLQILVSSQLITLPPELKAAVDAHWDAILVRQPHYFKGPVLSVETITFSGMQWTIRARFTDYAHYLYSRFQLPSSHPHRVRVLFAAALVISQDRYLIAGVMGQETARPGWIQSIGGSPVFQDVADEVFDPIRSTNQELKEETGLSPEALRLSRKPQVLGCTVDGNGSVAIAVGYFSRLTSVELKDLIKQSWKSTAQPHARRELADIVAIPLGQSGINWMRNRRERHVRYLERMVRELQDWPV
ncbi:MAG: hypothetical protein C7B46_01090 [Sulfobacillus benefaciens]|uniref:Nudix hydrolase domain-containing protein n=1 Tax=Sulfobacillus benefaciens TaxID=453960 RepID=A0A2T2XLC9_9FIRM|nr:MAG: hypothetical protein C7B46_01090 [Sulfobacillus benefaciens]